MAKLLSVLAAALAAACVSRADDGVDRLMEMADGIEAAARQLTWAPVAAPPPKTKIVAIPVTKTVFKEEVHETVKYNYVQAPAPVSAPMPTPCPVSCSPETKKKLGQDLKQLTVAAEESIGVKKAIEQLLAKAIKAEEAAASFGNACQVSAPSYGSWSPEQGVPTATTSMVYGAGVRGSKMGKVGGTKMGKVGGTHRNTRKTVRKTNVRVTRPVMITHKSKQWFPPVSAPAPWFPPVSAPAPWFPPVSAPAPAPWFPPVAAPAPKTKQEVSACELQTKFKSEAEALLASIGDLQDKLLGKLAIVKGLTQAIAGEAATCIPAQAYAPAPSYSAPAPYSPPVAAPAPMYSAPVAAPAPSVYGASWQPSYSAPAPSYPTVSVSYKEAKPSPLALLAKCLFKLDETLEGVKKTSAVAMKFTSASLGLELAVGKAQGALAQCLAKQAEYQSKYPVASAPSYGSSSWSPEVPTATTVYGAGVGGKVGGTRKNTHRNTHRNTRVGFGFSKNHHFSKEFSAPAPWFPPVSAPAPWFPPVAAPAPKTKFVSVVHTKVVAVPVEKVKVVTVAVPFPDCDREAMAVAALEKEVCALELALLSSVKKLAALGEAAADQGSKCFATPYSAPAPAYAPAPYSPPVSAPAPSYSAPVAAPAPMYSAPVAAPAPMYSAPVAAPAPAPYSPPVAAPAPAPYSPPVAAPAPAPYSPPVSAPAPAHYLRV